MKVLMLATLAVILLRTQMVWGNQPTALQIPSGIAHMVEMIFQTVRHKKSLDARQMRVGSCSQADIQNFLRDYPADCERKYLRIDFNAIAAGDFGDFADDFCNQRCGQPLVDLALYCNDPKEAAALVYTCRINENGDTCGRILQTFVNVATIAENACLPHFSFCSSSCRTRLQNLRDSVGCCGNFTEVGIQLNLIDLAIDEYTLWNSCGVRLTGVCAEGVLNSGKILAATKITVIGLAILTMVVLVETFKISE